MEEEEDDESEEPQFDQDYQSERSDSSRGAHERRTMQNVSIGSQGKDIMDLDRSEHSPVNNLI